MRPLDETLLASSLRKTLIDAAVLEPQQRVCPVEGTTPCDGALGALRRYAQEVDRACGDRGGGDREQAVRAWLALVSGRWKWVDRFDGGGRRYLVARREQGATSAPLSIRERQVLAYASLGYSNKYIAYTLGLAPSTVSSHLCKAMRRVGLTSRAALAELLAPFAGAELTGIAPAS